MIFISHQHNDKEIVSPIAYALEQSFGEENVFYDDWSIKPGENIIERMNEGLEQARYFFFFITENSLRSQMVSLEWTSAIKARSENMKFIPIRAENVNVPFVISALNYLDMSTNGIDVTLQQIREIVNPDIVKHARNVPTFNNVSGYVYQENYDSFHYVIRAKRFFEPSGSLVACTTLTEEQAIFSADVNTYGYGYHPNSMTVSGQVMNAFVVDLQGGLKAGFNINLSFKILNEEGNSNSDNVYLFHQKTQDDFQLVELTPVLQKQQIPWLY
ncbi:toll/interleukin-1 receptor domain-containing protein [Exiguobacterium sp. s91]|uniref:toll/interleukin-1 receptor domain-containing protein n=1 Tax=Exiguobacterium sp. s91 TaxID=2751199 RepID=UPI001BEBB50A|nr:toll/interleukin-1 receptor domain-containing protein [Exiguobacterium sp. s91]